MANEEIRLLPHQQRVILNEHMRGKSPAQSVLADVRELQKVERFFRQDDPDGLQYVVVPEKKE